MSILNEMNKNNKAKNKATQGQVYTKDDNGNIKFINFEDVKVGNITLKEFIQHIEEMNKNLLDNINNLIKTLKDTTFIDPEKDYTIIINGIPTNCKGSDIQLLTQQDISNFEYKKIVDGKIVLDNKKIMEVL